MPNAMMQQEVHRTASVLAKMWNLNLIKGLYLTTSTQET